MNQLDFVYEFREEKYTAQEFKKIVQNLDNEIEKLQVLLRSIDQRKLKGENVLGLLQELTQNIEGLQYHLLIPSREVTLSEFKGEYKIPFLFNQLFYKI